MVIKAQERLAELWTIKKSRQWTSKEAIEFGICMDAHTNYVSRMAVLQNFSAMAHMTDDKEWQREISDEVKRLKAGLGRAKPKHHPVKERKPS